MTRVTSSSNEHHGKQISTVSCSGWKYEVTQVEDTKRGRILIVHNDSREASEVRMLLENLGYMTASTWSGFEALERLRAERFDVLLTDSHVPDLYIGELIERASALQSGPQILVLRNRRPVPDLSRFEALGFCAILDKQRVAARLRIGEEEGNANH